MPCHAPPDHQAHALRICSETATTATTLPACGVGRCGGDVLDASNAHTGTGKSAESGLGTGARGLGAVTTGGADLDVEGRDAELLAAGSYRSLVFHSSLFCDFLRVRTDVLGSQHGGVGGGLVTVGLDLHATGNTGDGLTAAGITQVSLCTIFLSNMPIAGSSFEFADPRRVLFRRTRDR